MMALLAASSRHVVTRNAPDQRACRIDETVYHVLSQHLKLSSDIFGTMPETTGEVGSGAKACNGVARTP